MGQIPYADLLPPDDPLFSTFAKIDRAAELYISLGEGLDAFMETEPIGVNMHFNEEPGWTVAYFQPREDPPVRLALVCADFIGNLRAALDHLIYALARLRVGGDPERTAFPIMGNETEYRRRRGRNGTEPSLRDSLLNGLTEDDKKIVDRWQPFGQPNRPLAVLRDFNNRDKHRLLAPGFVAVEGVRVVPTTPMDHLVVRIKKAAFSGLHTGDEFFRVHPVNPTTDQIGINFDGLVGIAFGDRRLGLKGLHVLHVEVVRVIESLIPRFPDPGHYSRSPDPEPA